MVLTYTNKFSKTILGGAKSTGWIIEKNIKCEIKKMKPMSLTNQTEVRKLRRSRLVCIIEVFATTIYLLQFHDRMRCRS